MAQTSVELDEKPKFYASDKIKASMAAGQITEADIDHLLARRYLKMFEFWHFDSPYSSFAPTDFSQGAAVAKQAAEEGIVLLKNDRNFLPVGRNIKSVALIGTEWFAGMASLPPRNGDPAELTTVVSPRQYTISPEQGLRKTLGKIGVAANGVGKSTLALALAGAVAHGRTFLGRPTLKVPTLYVDGENPLQVIKERQARLSIASTDTLRIWGGWNTRLVSGPNSEPIVNYALERKGLIIFDSLIQFHTGSEQDSSETRRYLDQYRRLAHLGPGIVLLHHTGKGEGAKQYRGSSDGVGGSSVLPRGPSATVEAAPPANFAFRLLRRESLWWIHYASYGMSEGLT